MEFNEKLQELRKQKGVTQEELADALYVSRTAVSKWESGRGYPSIDSLKAIAKYFNITIDELLSSDELLILAEENSIQNDKSYCDLVFGLLDISILSFLFLPLFGQQVNDIIQEVSLLNLTDISLYLRISYFIISVSFIICGILTLALQNITNKFWQIFKNKISIVLNIIGVLLFVISQQPYAATFLIILLTIKVLMLLKKH